ncbi:hypothetical protein LINGRAHAP2_LOCUS33954 [Linum grandiflorum]
MAEASNGRVTITLGGGGQVVRRAVSDVGYSDSLLGSGGKRSVRDRLGGDAESSVSRGKRQRGDSYLSASNAAGIRDGRIGKDDLRLKLMQKNVGRRTQTDDDPRDLRDKITRKTQPPSVVGMRGSVVDPRETSLLGRIPPARSSSEVSQMESSRSSYSPWTLDHIRRRSPGRIITSSMAPERGVSSSRGYSPPRRVGEVQRRPLNRPYDDDLRPVPYMPRDVRDAPRPVSSSPQFMTKPGLATVSANSPAPIPGPVPPPSSGLQKQTYAEEEHQTIEGLLHSLGLGKYIVLFKAEEVDMTVLKQMGESDLKELGIPMVRFLFLPCHVKIITLNVLSSLTSTFYFESEVMDRGKRFFSPSCLVPNDNFDDKEAEVCRNITEVAYEITMSDLETARFAFTSVAVCCYS